MPCPILSAGTTALLTNGSRSSGTTVMPADSGVFAAIPSPTVSQAAANAAAAAIPVPPRPAGRPRGRGSLPRHPQPPGEPGGRDRRRRGDTDRAEPVDGARRRPEPQREGHSDDDRNGDRTGRHGGRDVTGQHGTA